MGVLRKNSPMEDYSIELYRADATDFLVEGLMARGYSFTDVADSIGVSNTLFSKFKSYDKQFALPLCSLEKLTHFYLNCSCSQLLFGQEIPIEPSKRMDFFLNKYKNAPRSTQAVVRKELSRNTIKKQRPRTPEEENSLIGQRLFEWVNDNDVNLYDYFCQVLQARNVAIISTFYGEPHTISLKNIYRICMSFKISPDYLLCRDYSEQLDIPNRLRPAARLFLSCPMTVQDSVIAMLAAS